MPSLKPYPTTLRHLFYRHITTPKPARPDNKAFAIRRRPTMTQGRALEILGHSIEYLVDSSFYGCEESSYGKNEACHILMRLSREVFSECREVKSSQNKSRRSLFDLFFTRRPT